MHISKLPPQSDIPIITGWLGVAGLFLGVLTLSICSVTPSIALPLLVIFCGLPMWVFECVRNKNKKLKWVFPRGMEMRSRLEELLGAVLVWLPVLVFMSIATPYHFFQAAELLWTWYPALLIPLCLHFFLQGEKSDENIGDLFRWLARKPFAVIPWASVRAQVVKAFFLPLMMAFSYVWLAQAEIFNRPRSPLQAYMLIMAILYMVDTIFCTIGYLSTTPRLNAHIRSTDSTWLGWLSALSCYPPFFGVLIALGIAKYKYGPPWNQWLDLSGFLAFFWGSAIILLSAIYVWATIVFGVRFSNLTNRGVVTTGPFRFSKHPAYISKNISWWLILVPFFSHQGTFQSILNCCSLLFVNLIYFVRAKTEERHMLNDPAYQAYALWIAEFGVLARLRRAFRIQLSRISQNS